MIKKQFMPNELSKEAFEAYSNSDYVFVREDGTYTAYTGTVSGHNLVRAGMTLQDVEDLLLQS